MRRAYPEDRVQRVRVRSLRFRVNVSKKGKVSLDLSSSNSLNPFLTVFILIQLFS